MFFLSKGVLKKLINRQPFNDKIFLGDSYVTMNLLKQSTYVILQISDIYFFQEENVVGIELFDGSETDYNYTAHLDPKLWDVIDKKYIETKSTSKYYDETQLSDNASISYKSLLIGSVILVKEYSFENVITKEFTRRNASNELEIVTTYLEDNLKIIDFVIIGHDMNFKSTVN